jgi:hypothetical protein
MWTQNLAILNIGQLHILMHMQKNLLHFGTPK